MCLSNSWRCILSFSSFQNSISCMWLYLCFAGLKRLPSTSKSVDVSLNSVRHSVIILCLIWINAYKLCFLHHKYHLRLDSLWLIWSEWFVAFNIHFSYWMFTEMTYILKANMWRVVFHSLWRLRSRCEFRFIVTAGEQLLLVLPQNDRQLYLTRRYR